MGEQHSSFADAQDAPPQVREIYLVETLEVSLQRLPSIPQSLREAN